MKILCVDDSALIRKIVMLTADVLGLATVEASNGKNALSILEEQWKDIRLITLDWHMPEMNGMDFLHTIKSREHLKSIPVLMLTSESRKENIVKAIKVGVDNYLLKPFTQEDLLVRIRECLGDALI